MSIIEGGASTASGGLLREKVAPKAPPHPELGTPPPGCGGVAARAVPSPIGVPLSVLAGLDEAASAAMGEDAPASTGAVAALEAYVGRRVGLPGRAALSWSFETTGIEAGTYRATVSFIVDKPLTFCGSWLESHLKAQQDTAEKVLWYFGEIPPAASKEDGEDSKGGAISALHAFVRNQSGLSSSDRILVWDYEMGPGNSKTSGGPVFRATVSFSLKGKHECFCGSWQPSKKKAQKDAAQRVVCYIHQQEQQRARLIAGRIAGSPLAAAAPCGLPPMDLDPAAASVVDPLDPSRLAATFQDGLMSPAEFAAFMAEAEAPVFPMTPVSPPFPEEFAAPLWDQFAQPETPSTFANGPAWQPPTQVLSLSDRL